MIILKNFYGSILFAVAAIILSGVTGYAQGGAGLALEFVFLALVLGIMETSLSLDNAVVDATILKSMPPVWQKRFITWGILIAVFGMRIVFPILIVAVSAWVSPWEAVRIAFTEPATYEVIIKSAHVGISGFGGAFLMLVGLTFFFDADREHLWLKPIEAPLALFAKVPFAQFLATIALIGGLSLMIDGHERQTFLLAGGFGILCYFLVHKIGDWIGGGVPDATGTIVRSGLGSFIYLEFLDASFSFDGVIGAFAITNNIILIALGLGTGAMFVRSMTITLVRGGHLAEFRYLESGAFYAIVALATIMLISIRVETPEIVTGLVGACMIGLALYASIRHRKRHPEQYTEDDEVTLPSGDVIP